MKYPDGEEIMVGDLIWWDGGMATGYVQSTIDSEEELREWDLEEPHLFLANIHPYDPASVAGIGCPQNLLEDDGIRPFSSDEKQQLEAATREAVRLAGIDFSTVPHAISVEREEGAPPEWVFSVIEGEELIETVRVPF